jgi:hypothetical protein
MARDPRVNLLIHGLPVDRPNQAGNGPNYAAISGIAKITDDPDGTFTKRCTHSTWVEQPLPPNPEHNA